MAEKATDSATTGATTSVTAMDLPAHERNYSGFVKVLKWASIAVAATALIVLLIIAN